MTLTPSLMYGLRKSIMTAICFARTDWTKSRCVAAKTSFPIVALSCKRSQVHIR